MLGSFTDTSSVGMLAYSIWSSRKCSRSYSLADSSLLGVHYLALCFGMVIFQYSGVGGGSAVQTQLEGSGGPEHEPCATKLFHQEQNTVETLKAHIAVRVVRQCVRHVLVASPLRG